MFKLVVQEWDVFMRGCLPRAESTINQYSLGTTRIIFDVQSHDLEKQLVLGWPSNVGFLLADLPHGRAMPNSQFGKATGNFR